MAARALRRLITGGCLLALGTSGAEAVPFNIDGWQGQFDSTLSYRAAWSLEAADADWIGRANDGNASGQWHDDSRLNFTRGDTFVRRFEGEHALELHDTTQGLFLRGRYWHDQASSALDRSGWPDAAQASGAEWLDAFYFREHSIGAQPGVLRVGRQRLYWGSAHFLGLDPINPQDHTRRHDPFVALADTARPLAMLFASQELADRLGFEAFHAWEWQPDLLPGCGSFRSVNDVQAGSCDGFDTGAPPPSATVLQTIAEAAGQGYEVGPQGVRVPRASADEAADAGQFGVTLRWRGDLAAYRLQFVNAHSRRAFLSLAGAPAQTWAALPAILTTTAAAIGPDSGDEAAAWQREAVLLGNLRYRLAYPEDIRQWSASASGRIGSRLHWAGELSFRPNAPVQQSVVAALARIDSPSASGVVEPGYRRRDVTRLVMSLAGELERIGGVDRVGWRAEAGHVHVGGLGTGQPITTVQAREASVTADAWGYRLYADAEYRDVWPRVDLLPSLGFSHDVNGFDPDGLLSEGAKAVTVGLGVRYLRSYQFRLGYTAHHGGRYNVLADRDFVSVETQIAF